MVAALTAVQNVDHNGFSLLVPVLTGRTQSEQNGLALILMTEKSCQIIQQWRSQKYV